MQDRHRWRKPTGLRKVLADARAVENAVNNALASGLSSASKPADVCCVQRRDDQASGLMAAQNDTFKLNFFT